MRLTRWGQTATKLQDGNVLIAGGWGQMAGNSAELYVTAPIVATSLSVSPSTATLQVGEVRSFTVVDQLSFGRSDAEWSISNPAVATVDVDSGVVTAVAPGTAVLTATVGTLTATAQVAVVGAGSLPAGAVRWTLAAPAGFTTKQVIQAHDPDEGSPSSFVVNGSASDTQIVALSADGQLLWQFWLPSAATNFVPNSSGGLIATLYNSCDGINPMRLVSIDGATGMWAWEFVGSTTCGSETPRMSVRTDGAVAVATPGNLTGFPSFMLLSGTTGTPLPVPAIPSSTFTSFNGQQVPGISRVGPAMTDRDGVVHLLYEKRLVGYPPQVIDTGMWLMSVKPDQSYTTTQLSSTTDNTNLFPGYIIPDGNGGLVATWVDSPIVPVGMPPAQSTFRAARISAASVVTNFDIPLVPPVDLPKQPGSALPVNPVLTLGEDQRAFVTYVDKLVAFSLADGSLLWDYQAPSGTMAAVRSDLSNGIVAKNTVGGVDTVLRFSASGGYTTDPVSGIGVDYSRGLGWVGTSSSSGSGATAYSGSPINLSTAGWSSPTQESTAAADPLVTLKEPKQTNPEQAKIKVTYETARDLLANDAQLPNPTCSTWFNTGFPLAGFATSAPNYIDTKVLPNHFAHAVILIGGQEPAGEHISAFQGQANPDKLRTPVGALPDTLLTFNRSGTFFQFNYTLYAYNPVRQHNIGGTLLPNGNYAGGYGGGSKRAQLAIALHELAHLLQTAPISVNTVPGFQNDGEDSTGALSRANTQLLFDNCKTMIERYH